MECMKVESRFTRKVKYGMHKSRAMVYMKGETWNTGKRKDGIHVPHYAIRATCATNATTGSTNYLA